MVQKSVFKGLLEQILMIHFARRTFRLKGGCISIFLIYGKVNCSVTVSIVREAVSADYGHTVRVAIYHPPQNSLTFP